MKCRTCFERRGTIFLWDKGGKTFLTKRLLAVTGVKVMPNDGLPNAICEVCSKSLNVAYRFRIRTRKTDRALKSSCNFFDSDHDNGTDLKPDVEFMNESVFLYNNSTNKDPLSPVNSKRKEKFLDDSKDFSLASIKDDLNLKENVELEKSITTFNQSVKENVGLKRITKRRRHDGVRHYECETCNKKFYTYNYLVVHMRTHTGETPYNCTKCSKSFSQLCTLIRHNRIHTGDKPYSCEICGKKFASKNEKKNHQTVHSEERKFSCDICGKSFKTKSIIANHIKLHYNSRMHICDKCGIKCSSKGNLKQHINYVHTDKSGQCTVCNKLVSNLQDHMPKHTGETPFQCHLCNRSFSRKNSLSVHLFNHNNQGKYVCNVGKCTKTFAVKSAFTFHTLKYHSDQTPYECSKCEKKYFRHCDLIKHLKLYHKESISK